MSKKRTKLYEANYYSHRLGLGEEETFFAETDADAIVKAKQVAIWKLSECGFELKSLFEIKQVKSVREVKIPE
jgi:hypothetical protein